MSAHLYFCEEVTLQDTRYSWQRYVIPSDKQPLLTSEGYLDPPYGPYSQSDMKKDVDLVSIPCVILLGEMGIGKSAVMTTLRDETERQGRQTLAINLRPYTNEQLLQDELFRSPQFAYWQASTDHLHIFLDGFDECPTRIPALGALIADNLASLSTESLARLSIRIRVQSSRMEGKPTRKAIDTVVARQASSGLYGHATQ